MTEFVAVVLLFVAAAIATAVGMLVLGWLVGPKRSGAVKEMPYESGMDPMHDARRRFDVRFHLVAIAFLVFDVELLFLYPWAVAARATPAAPAGTSAAVTASVEGGLVDQTSDSSNVDSNVDASERADSSSQPSRAFANQPVSRGLVFGGVMFFMALVVLGLVYEWKKGILQWR